MTTYNKLVYGFKDFNEVVHTVEIFRGVATPVYTIVYGSADDPVDLHYSGGGKDTWDETYIQGLELSFRFHVPREDIAVVEDLMESNYKDWKVKLSRGSTVLFHGFLKPENMTKRFEVNPPYIEVDLSATDGLADLKEIDFYQKEFDSSAGTVTGTLRLLEVIRDSLNFLGFEFPFHIQLNTYEAPSMPDTDHSALYTGLCNAKRFYDIHTDDEGVTEIKPIKCWDAIEMVLAPFNCKLFQYNEAYWIVNHFELNSYYHVYEFTLWGTGRIANNLTIDVSEYLYKPYVEQQKVDPLKSLMTIIDNEVGDSDPVRDFMDWDNVWQFSTGSGTAWQYRTTLPNGDFHGVVINTNQPYMILQAPIPIINQGLTKQYLRFRFGFRLVLWDKYDGGLFGIGAGKLSDLDIKVRISRDGTWSRYIRLGAPYVATATNPGWRYYDSHVDPLFEIYETPSDGTPVQYNVEILIDSLKGKNHFDQLIFQITELQITQYDARQGFNNEWNPTLVNSGPSYYQLNVNGYRNLENTLMLFDAVSIDDKAALIVFSPTELTNIVTNVWSTYGKTEYAKIVDIRSRLILFNRSRYKNFLRGSLIDRDHNIDFNNVLIIHDRYYVFTDYNKNIRTGILEFGLLELIRGGTDDYDEIQDITSIAETTPFTGPIHEYVLNEEVYVTKSATISITATWEVGDVIRAEYNALTDEYDYYLAKADTLSNATSIGVITEIIDATTFKYASEGYIPPEILPFTVNIGTYYYLSDITAGKMTTIPPSIKQVIGFGTERGFKVEIDPVSSSADEKVATADKTTGELIGEPGYLDDAAFDVTEVAGKKVYTPKTSGVIEIPTITQNGHGFIVGDVIRHNGTAYVKAQADNDVNAQACGIVSEYIDTNQFKFIADGVIEGLGTPGAEYFLSTTTAGQLITLPTPEAWNLGEVRLSCGWGTPLGLKVEIDVGDVISSFEFPTAELKGYWDREFEFCINAGIAETFDVDLWAVYEYDIIEAILESDGTLSGVSISIGSNPVGGLNNLTVATIAMTVATSANTVLEGNRVTISTTASYSGNPTVIKGKLKILRA